MDVVQDFDVYASGRDVVACVSFDVRAASPAVQFEKSRFDFVFRERVQKMLVTQEPSMKGVDVFQSYASHGNSLSKNVALATCFNVARRFHGKKSNKYERFEYFE
jgi:hypothetical protein